MKNLSLIAVALAIGLWPLDCPAQTPIYDYGYLAPGVPQTNPVVIQAWPVANAWIAFNLTNTVYVVTTTNTPNSSGYWSNSLYPTTYRKIIPALNAVMYFTVPNTTQALSVAQCATAIAASSSTLTTYGLITNWLGYAPPLPTPAGITTALGYTPITNTYSALTNVLSFIPATNGGPLAYSQLPYAPPTNSYGGLTNVLGFAPATNSTAGIIGALGWTPPTNSYSALTNVLGFIPATNVFGANTNVVFLGQNTTNTAYFTNGLFQRMSTP